MDRANLEGLKVGYAIVLYGSANSGVYKKISDQISQWIKLGVEPHLFVITDESSVTSWSEFNCEVDVLVDTNLLNKIRHRFQLLRRSKKAGIDLLYVRDVFPLLYPKFSIPVVLEVQSLHSSELSLRNRKALLLYQVFSKFMYKQVSAAVYVTNELLEVNEARLSDKSPKKVIGNGISLSRVKSFHPQASDRLSIFFVGHPNQPWHGIADLVDFIGIHPEIDLHLVGDESRHPFPNVFSHGSLDEKSYAEIAESCVAGVGSLALITIGLREASPLKSREYLAMGLPVIARYSDPDFTPAPNYILELPQDGSTLESHAEEILTFLKYWSGKRVPRNSIAHVDVQSKETLRLDFFQDILLQFKSNYAKAGER